MWKREISSCIHTRDPLPHGSAKAVPQRKRAMIWDAQLHQRSGVDKHRNTASSVTLPVAGSSLDCQAVAGKWYMHLLIGADTCGAESTQIEGFLSLGRHSSALHDESLVEFETCSLLKTPPRSMISSTRLIPCDGALKVMHNNFCDHIYGFRDLKVRAGSKKSG